MYISLNDSSWNLANGIISVTILETNKNYCTKIRFIGTNYNVYLSDITLNSSTAIFNNQNDNYLLLRTDFDDNKISTNLNITLFNTETNTNLTYYPLHRQNNIAIFGTEEEKLKSLLFQRRRES